ncbi:hypothetical protein [Enterococcus canintestini]|uniref:Uncharacterized protein n=1 Tax=Enterococcus canintestini TaxID=317010 RepID=A0A1L8R9C3_9ENTE|nr:hypothetical protein [Enterococcus canintestini]OJG16371.1 hypothetical protein RU96_GL001113 [Enterococcus canintestini]
MGEKIVFPDELQRIIRLGKKKMAEEEYLSSCQYFKKAYEMEMSFTVNQLYVAALLKLEDFPTALNIAEDFFEEYKKDEETLAQYLRILLLNQQFLVARKTIYQSSLLTKEKTHAFMHQVEQLELAVDLLDPENLQQKRQLLKSWDQNKGPVTPNAWAKFQQQLTYPQFVALMQDFLPTSKNNFLRPRLIEELVLLKCDKTITTNSWQDVTMQVELTKLSLPEEIPAYKVMQHYFESEIAAVDVQMAQYCLAELKMDLALTYPFVPFTKNTALWQESYVLQYQQIMGKSIAEKYLEELLEVNLQKEKIRQIYHEIL